MQIGASLYTGAKKYWHLYLISTSLWMGIKYIKSAARLLHKNWVNKRDLDLFKEVLWVSVGQRVAELRAVKVGGQKKILLICPVRVKQGRTGLSGRIFFQPPTLKARSSAASWSTEIHTISWKTSKPPLLTQSLSKSKAAFLTYFIFIQNLISIVLLSKGASIFWLHCT